MISVGRGLSVLLALAFVLWAGCSPCHPDAGGRSGGSQGGAVVSGTVIDAQNGELLGGVRIEGPGGASTVSDADGRFELRDVASGVSGTLVGTLQDGRIDELAVGPLEARDRLEVVLRLTSP